MNTFNILSIILLLLNAVTIRASDNGEIVEEKARARNDKQDSPTAGQVIFAASSLPKATEAPATQVVEAAPKATATPNPKPSNDSPSKGKKEIEAKEDPKQRKNAPKKGKNSAETEDDTNELPKRLFRPRFRADSAADSLKISFAPIFISLLLAMALF